MNRQKSSSASPDAPGGTVSDHIALMSVWSSPAFLVTSTREAPDMRPSPARSTSPESVNRAYATDACSRSAGVIAGMAGGAAAGAAAAAGGGAAAERSSSSSELVAKSSTPSLSYVGSRAAGENAPCAGVSSKFASKDANPSFAFASVGVSSNFASKDANPSFAFAFASESSKEAKLAVAETAAGSISDFGASNAANAPPAGAGAA